MGGLDQEEQLKELGSIIAKTMSEDIKLGVEADLPKWQDSIMKHLKDRLGSTVTLVDQQTEDTRLAARDRELKEKIDEINELTAKNNSLVDQTQQLKQEVVDWKQRAQEHQTKVKGLHKIILETGLREEAPIDNQVVTLFSQLKQRILQLIKKHCLRQEARIRVYQDLPSDVKDWWIMALICDVLWDHFFSPDALWFGFDFVDDELLSRFEANITKSNKVPLLDLIEWRVRNVQLAKFFHNEAGPRFIPSAEAIRTLSRKLGPFIYQGGKDAKRLAEEQKGMLADICAQAFRIALLFRGTKTEYSWLQKGAMDVDDTQLEVLGTASSNPFKETCPRRMVFGAVVKGGGSHGMIKDEAYILRKGEILLGPFEDSSSKTTVVPGWTRTVSHGSSSFY